MCGKNATKKAAAYKKINFIKKTDLGDFSSPFSLTLLSHLPVLVGTHSILFHPN